MTTRLPLSIEVFFPNLTADNYRCTSPTTQQYNCIGHAASDSQRWWWPSDEVLHYWPILDRQNTLNCFIEGFSTLGYELCNDGSFEVGYEKIAIYADSNGDPTHGARQLADGKWTSKLGKSHDIEHDTLDALDGTAYGRAVLFMRRARSLAGPSSKVV